MTKRDAESIFRSEILPGIREREEGVPDYPLRSTSWNDFTDSLCKDGQITNKQYENWGHPLCNYSPGELKEKRSRRLNLVAHIMES